MKLGPRRTGQTVLFEKQVLVHSGWLLNLVLAYWFWEKRLRGNKTSNKGPSCRLNLVFLFGWFLGKKLCGKNLSRAVNSFLSLFFAGIKVSIAFFLLTRKILGLSGVFDIFGFLWTPLAKCWVLLLEGRLGLLFVPGCKKWSPLLFSLLIGNRERSLLCWYWFELSLAFWPTCPLSSLPSSW